ncbi:MAG: helix-turn-helix transcriptional regulator [Candidatus Aminicenantales bacterium]
MIAENRLREIRKGRGMTQGVLAGLAGISSVAVCLIERRKNGPRERTAEAIARALRLPVYDVFPVFGNREKPVDPDAPREAGYASLMSAVAEQAVADALDGRRDPDQAKRARQYIFHSDKSDAGYVFGFRNILGVMNISVDKARAAIRERMKAKGGARA